MGEVKPRLPESEKITINMGHVDLGQIDLLVRDGFFSNRTDLIRTAIRNLLERHADNVQKSAARNDLSLGLRQVSRAELQAAWEEGTPLRLNVLGLAIIAADVPPDLARAAIKSIQVLGTLHASAEVKAALRDRFV